MNTGILVESGCITLKNGDSVRLKVCGNELLSQEVFKKQLGFSLGTSRLEFIISSLEMLATFGATGHVVLVIGGSFDDAIKVTLDEYGITKEHGKIEVSWPGRQEQLDLNTYPYYDNEGREDIFL